MGDIITNCNVLDNKTNYLYDTGSDRDKSYHTPDDP